MRRPDQRRGLVGGGSAVMVRRDLKHAKETIDGLGAIEATAVRVRCEDHKPLCYLLDVFNCGYGMVIISNTELPLKQIGRLVEKSKVPLFQL